MNCIWIMGTKSPFLDKTEGIQQEKDSVYYRYYFTCAEEKQALFCIIF